tara:strand:+ start:772 stop:1599 length:828 start_codon:yes stop_codon:yes gene_type:complete
MRLSIIFLFFLFTYSKIHSQTWINEVSISPFPLKECDSVFVIIDGNMPATNCSPFFSHTIELNEVIVDVNITCPGIGGPAITTYDEIIQLGLLFSNDYTIVVNQYLDSNLQETYTSSFTVEKCCDSIDATITQLVNNIEVTNIQNAVLPCDFQWNTGDTTQSIYPTSNGSFWVLITDANNCLSDTLMFDVDFVEINGLENKTKGLSIVPNPSKGTITIDTHNYDSNIQTTVLDIFGNKLFTTTEKSISLESVTKGIYFLIITIENYTSTYTIVKN